MTSPINAFPAAARLDFQQPQYTYDQALNAAATVLEKLGYNAKLAQILNTPGKALGDDGQGVGPNRFGGDNRVADTGKKHQANGAELVLREMKSILEGAGVSSDIVTSIIDKLANNIYSKLGIPREARDDDASLLDYAKDAVRFNHNTSYEAGLANNGSIFNFTRIENHRFDENGIHKAANKVAETSQANINIGIDIFKGLPNSASKTEGPLQSYATTSRNRDPVIDGIIEQNRDLVRTARDVGNKLRSLGDRLFDALANQIDNLSDQLEKAVKNLEDFQNKPQGGGGPLDFLGFLGPIGAIAGAGAKALGIGSSAPGKSDQSLTLAVSNIAEKLKTLLTLATTSLGSYNQASSTGARFA
jgi:hypothetical protein